MPSPKGLPPATRRTRPSRWPALAEQAMGQPNVAILVGENLPTSTVNSARQFLWPDWVTSEGHIQVNLRNSAFCEDGRKRGDLYLTFIPKKNRRKK